MVLKTIGVLHPRSLMNLSEHLGRLVERRLWLQVIIGMIAGLAVGVMIGPSMGWVPEQLGSNIGNWLALPGLLFLAAIQMIVIPLVFASIIRGLAAGENLAQLKRLGLASIAFFVLMTAVAAALGLWLADLIQPGIAVGETMKMAAVEVAASQQDQFGTPALRELPERVVALLPGNPLNSMVEGEMLQVVIFAAVVGVALMSMSPTSAKPMLDVLGSLQEVCMTVVRWAMMLAPYAVFGLMARLTSQVGFDALLGMGMYMLTVLLGLFLLLVLYLVIVLVFVRIGPWSFLRSMRELLLLAFSTSSSAAVMPLSIRTAEEKFSVRPSISQFVIPLGATVNMNGTALYQGVATVFLAQVYGVEIGMGGLALVVIMAVGASIGSPATPGVGIVILSMLLSSIGIPPGGVALIMGVDRILDMCRTAVNVSGDVVACTLMDKWIGSSKSAVEEFAEQQQREELRQQTGEDVVAQTQ